MLCLPHGKCSANLALLNCDAATTLQQSCRLVLSPKPLNPSHNPFSVIIASPSLSHENLDLSPSIYYYLTSRREITRSTSLIHSRLDYCSSLFLYLPSTELDRLQLVLNATACAVTKTKFLHTTSLLF